LNVVNGKASLSIGESFLKEVIGNGLKDLRVQEFFVDASLLGTINILVQDISLKSLEVANGRILLELEIALELVPESRLLPSFEGVVGVSGNMSMMVGQEGTDIDFEMGELSWLKGPTSLRSGKPLRLVRAATDLVSKYSQGIERSIGNKISSLFSPEEIGELISGVPENVVFGDLVVSMTGLQIHLINLEFVGDHLEIRVDLDADYVLASEQLNLTFERGLVLGKSSAKESSIYISQAELNFLLENRIEVMNKQLASSLLRISKVEVELEAGLIIVKVSPEGLISKPIICRIGVSTGPGAELILDQLEVASDPDASLFVKALLRLVSGKVETEIEKYFPLSFREIEHLLLSQIKEIGESTDRSHSISVREFRVESIEVLERQLLIRSSGLVQIETM